MTATPSTPNPPFSNALPSKGEKEEKFAASSSKSVVVPRRLLLLCPYGRNLAEKLYDLVESDDFRNCIFWRPSPFSSSSADEDKKKNAEKGKVDSYNLIIISKTFQHDILEKTNLFGPFVKTMKDMKARVRDWYVLLAG